MTVSYENMKFSFEELEEQIMLAKKLIEQRSAVKNDTRLTEKRLRFLQSKLSELLPEESPLKVKFKLENSQGEAKQKPESLKDKVERMVQEERQRVEDKLGVKLSHEDMEVLRARVQVEAIFPGSKFLGYHKKKKRFYDVR